MDTSTLKKFARNARRSLIEQVGSKLTLVLAEHSAARRQYPNAVARLEKEIGTLTKERVIEKVAYTWFNRFCALRFMDVNRYTPMGIVSAAVGRSQPEILAEAKMGHIEDKMVLAKTQSEVAALLSGETPSRDPQGEAYRLLLVAVCNSYHRAMPYLFERIADYVELLIPDDLLSPESILAATREAMSPEACENVEVIGWLYQFYISEKKDKVFAGLKKKQKITTENIPAATQLFTPHWIVRYLVENSLGRLWMLNQPGSKLIEKMEYYIPPEEAERNFLQVKTPEEIKICDPACGSGHMLVYAFDLLYAIYEEEGYEPSEIPEKILTHNLYGIEIDERAGELAAFALTMKAREKYRRFLRKPVQPNICVLQPIELTDNELSDYMDFVGRDLFTVPLLETLDQFKEADNFGSLIRPIVTDVENMLKLLKNKNVGGQLLLYQIHQKVLQVLKQADYLGSKYHVVVANPPYMGGKGMNGQLKAFLEEKYPQGKADLMTCFMERSNRLIKEGCFWGMINLPSWMFLQSFIELRSFLFTNLKLSSLLHLGRGIFGSDFGSTAFIFYKPHKAYIQESISTNGSYRKLFDSNSTVREPNEIKKRFLEDKQTRYISCQKNFIKLPGTPVAYWFTDKAIEVFDNHPSLEEMCEAKQGMATADNNRFLRLWHEVSISNIGFDKASRAEAVESSCKWFPYNKGGEFRKWYGNQDYVVNWENDGKELLGNRPKSVIRSPHKYFRPSASWSKVTIGGFSLRYYPQGFIFDVAGCSIFPKEDVSIYSVLGAMNAPVMTELYRALMPTVNYEVGQISKFPFCNISDNATGIKIVSSLVDYARKDWNALEISWNFERLPLLHLDFRQYTLKDSYRQLRIYWQQMTLKMQRLEEENNRIFIEAYGLQDELTPEVPLHEITLTCNPYYRYDHTKPEAELEALLLADTMKEYISYAVGCMFGRYSLDKPGLILANQGETIEDYERQVPEPTFYPNKNNVIPILDGDWFADDICDRFRQFLRVTFGEEHYQENLKFIERAIGKKIRTYFLKDFYNDHVKRYKKRPIYWLFSSPKGSFNALIYLHRYRPDTVSVVLNDYLREFLAKLNARVENLRQIEISADISQSEKTKAIKEIAKLTKAIEELKDYERDVLYPFAIQQVQLDLDDGVKVNYPKLGAALKKISGL